MVPLLSLLSLEILASASPPDPVWIPGIYDDADYDDVVVLLTDIGKGTPPMRAAPMELELPHVRFCRPVVGWASGVTASLALHFRSPPLS